MDATQDWIEAYKELCTLIKAKVTEVKYTDLWYQQIDFEQKEYPFPRHSVFFEFFCDRTETIGGGAQDMYTSISVYHVFYTYSDTFDEATNQATAFEFGDVIRKINNSLQGTEGVNFSSLNRTGFKRYPADSYLVCYCQTYNTIIRDYSGVKSYDTSKSLNDIPVNVQVQNQPTEPTGDSRNIGYTIEV
ncbi:MAG TPA: hypothetical protein VN698_13010 [Bacteroidia bacterium]|nr:hypothetical protein [Bacteroidia bacterium]